MAGARHVHEKDGESAETRALRAEICARSMHLNWFGPMTFDVMLACLPHEAYRLLDVGCGNGEFAARFLERNTGASCVCVDVIPMHLEVSRTRLRAYGDRAAFVEDALEGVGNWNSMGSFQAITVANVLHFIDDQDLDLVMRGLFSLLVPGGRLLTVQFVKPPEAMKAVYKDGQRALHERFQPTGADKEILDDLRARRKAIEAEGKPIGLDTRNIFHTPERLDLSLRQAGFVHVDTVLKIFGSEMLVAVRPGEAALS
jgi:SAM-dependent methyltransferase